MMLPQIARAVCAVGTVAVLATMPAYAGPEQTPELRWHGVKTMPELESALAQTVRIVDCKGAEQTCSLSVLLLDRREIADCKSIFVPATQFVTEQGEVIYGGLHKVDVQGLSDKSEKGFSLLYRMPDASPRTACLPKTITIGQANYAILDETFWAPSSVGAEGMMQLSPDAAANISSRWGIVGSMFSKFFGKSASPLIQLSIKSVQQSSLWLRDTYIGNTDIVIAIDARKADGLYLKRGSHKVDLGACSQTRALTVIELKC